MNIDTLNKFRTLAARRSPENLSCDGECSRREIQRRHAEIMRDWHMLEKLEGRRVTLDEIEATYGQ